MNDPQVVISGIEVDEGLAFLLNRLWKAGYRTIASCQERSSGIGYIHFADDDNLKDFVYKANIEAPGSILSASNNVVEFWTSAIGKLERLSFGKPTLVSAWPKS